MQSFYEARKEDGADISRLLESPVDAGLIQAIYMHGEVKRSAYLCGLKKDPASQGLIPYVRSLEDYYGLRVEDYYLLGDGREIKACAAVLNVSSYKQFTVKKHRGIMKPARAFNPLYPCSATHSCPEKMNR